MALALRFVPYTDNHGHFRPGWTVFMVACLIGALLASIYVIQVLEILKMKGFRRRQVATARPAAESEVEEGVLRELDTGTFAAVDPATGEMTAIDPDTGEIEPVTPQG